MGTRITRVDVVVSTESRQPAYELVNDSYVTGDHSFEPFTVSKTGCSSDRSVFYLSEYDLVILSLSSPSCS